MAGTSYIQSPNFGVGTVSVANSNLNGTGTIVGCFSAIIADTAAFGGSVIKSVTIKGTASTANQGMVRLFLYNGTTYFLFTEVPVTPTTQSGVLPTFSATIRTPINLMAGYQVFASTQMSDSFNVFLNGLNYGSTTVGTNTDYPAIQYGSNTGSAIVQVANSNLNGTGTLATVLTAISSSYGKNAGTIINSITIKAMQSTTQGMVRLFIDTGTGIYLWEEIMIPAVTQSGVIKTFSISFSPNLVLNADFILFATTQNSEAFTVTANATNFICTPS